MSRPLSRPYPCVFGAPVLDRVDPRIFRLTYFGRCMDCTFCHDACCQYGADIELIRVAEILKYRAELEAYLGVPRAEWFREDPADFGVWEDTDYPGGEYTRTRVVPLAAGRSPYNRSGCVFLDPAGRGCRLHRFALERGIDVHEFKPMICLIFPASFNQGVLTPAHEFEETNELVCQGPGSTIYRAARPDILYYFGPELVAELDRMEAEELAGHSVPPADRTIPLPVCSS
jgi:Fe-S-cluster containining protein